MGALALGLAAFAQGGDALAASTPSRAVLYRDGQAGRRLLDGDWFFRLDPQDQGLAAGYFRPNGLAGWSRVSVPNAWNATDLSDESQRGTIGWYRHDFVLPSARSGTRWIFRFESVNYRARVYLNGHQIGVHEGGYIPFEAPAGTRMHRGVNTLVLRVDNRHFDTDVPPNTEQEDGTPGGGWWNYGGILREAYLRPVRGIDLTSLEVRPILPCRSCDATIVARGLLRNPGGGKRSARLSFSIGGRSASSRAVTVPSGGQRQVLARVSVPDPRLWELDDPNLYAVRGSAVSRGTTYSTYRGHIGIRSIRVGRGGRVYLNGRQVRLRGASVHEDNPDVGAALSPGQIASNVGLLQDLGATITRAHYPLHPLFYELADRAGILIWDEIPFYRFPESQIRKTAVREKGLSYLETMVRRDFNHPSVLTWSVGNELPSRAGAGQSRYIREAAKLVRSLDSSRLIALDFAGYPTVGRTNAYAPLTALGINSYFGWYPGPSGTLESREALGPYLDQLHRAYPRKAAFVTEFGAEANRSGPVDEKGTYEFQSELMRDHLATYDSKPWLSGAIGWLLRDFRVRPGWSGGNPKPEPPVNFKGLVSERGARKPAFEDVARAFRAVDPVQ